jgi:cobalamin synthase
MKEAALICGLLSGIFGLLSALALMKGSAVMPWSRQSYSGESEPEQAFRKNAKWWTSIGLIGLFLAFAFSTGAAITSYRS